MSCRNPATRVVECAQAIAHCECDDVVTPDGHTYTKVPKRLLCDLVDAYFTWVDAKAEREPFVLSLKEEVDAARMKALWDAEFAAGTK